MYIVFYTKGSWEDWERKNIFVTEDEDFAIKYCERLDGIVRKLLSNFEKYLEENGFPNIENIGETNWWRWYKTNEYNGCYYEKIEKRN